jgi:hypothetical protein
MDVSARQKSAFAGNNVGQIDAFSIDRVSRRSFERPPPPAEARVAPMLVPIRSGKHSDAILA